MDDDLTGNFAVGPLTRPVNDESFVAALRNAKLDGKRLEKSLRH